MMNKKFLVSHVLTLFFVEMAQKATLIHAKLVEGSKFSPAAELKLIVDPGMRCYDGVLDV